MWDSREARRRPGGASRGGAFKSREGAKKRKFFCGARRKPLGACGGPKARVEPRGALRRPGDGKGRPKRPPRKCVVTHFEARGPKGRLEPWRGAAAKDAGALWNRGDAARGLGARKSYGAPGAPRG